MTAPAAAGPSTGRRLIDGVVPWIKNNLPQAVLAAVASGVFAYITNVWLMAFRYGGLNEIPSGTPSTNRGNVIAGGLFWALLPMVLFSVVGYRRAVGKERFWTEMRSIPATVATLFQRDGDAARIHLLWGAAMSLLVGLVLSPAIGAVLAIGILVAMPTVAGSLLSSAVFRVWSALQRKMQPGREQPVGGTLAMAVGLLGAAAGLAFSFLVDDQLFQVLAAVACGGAAVSLASRRASPPTALVLLIVLPAGLALLLLLASPASADDGDYLECGSDFGTWWSECQGAGGIRRDAITGAVVAAGFAPVGWAVGDILGRLGGGRGGGPGGGDRRDGPDLGDPSVREWVDGLLEDPAFREWREAHPELTGPFDDEGFSDYMDWRHAQGLADPPFPEDEDDQRPVRYREGPDDEGRPSDGERTDDGRTGDGTELRNPRTGEVLAVGPDGKVDYGGVRLDPDDAARRIAEDARWGEGFRGGQRLIDDYADLVRRAAEAPDDATRAAIQQQLIDKAAEINGSDEAKDILKDPRSDPEVANRVATDIANIYDGVKGDTIDILRRIGVERGGQPLTTDDLIIFRNATSTNTRPGMDQDMGLNEKSERQAIEDLNRFPPGSPEADDAMRRLLGERGVGDSLRERMNALEPGSPEWTAARDQLQGIDRRVADLTEQLANTPLKSPEGRALTEQLNGVRETNRITIDFDAARAALEGDLKGAADDAARRRIQNQIDKLAEISGGRTGRVEISPSTWNEITSDVMRRTYGEATGHDADQARMTGTQTMHREAYSDPNMTKNDPLNAPPDPDRAAQSASVSTIKADEERAAAAEGHRDPHQAEIEIARGTGKDLGNKTIPLLASDPNADPAKVDMLRRLQRELAEIGTGNVPPSVIDERLRQAIPEIPGLTLDQATRIADANLEAAIGWRGDRWQGSDPAERVSTGETPRATTETAPKPTAPEPARATTGDDAGGGGSRVGDAFGKVTDLATFEQHVQDNINKGMSPVEAAAVAAGQTAAGNAAVASGVADPRLGMVGGALLPGGMSGMLPDAAVENWAGTAYQTGSALAESIGTSLGSGQLDTTAIDKFADGVMERSGADPFKGVGAAAQLVGEEMARTDGGSLGGDLASIVETGAGAEVLSESAQAFQQEVKSGSHGVVLQGLDHVADAAAQLVTDPATTVGQFVDDVKTIITNGVGDGYWEGAREQTVKVLEGTPLVGSVVKGVEEIATGIGESGVTGFATEMAEGGMALAGEGAEAVANAASRTYDALRNLF